MTVVLPNIIKFFDLKQDNNKTILYGFFNQEIRHSKYLF